jgi:hypothetical protein
MQSDQSVIKTVCNRVGESYIVFVVEEEPIYFRVKLATHRYLVILT